MVGGAARHHRLAQPGQLVGPRGGGLRRQVLDHRRGRQRRALGPGAFERIAIGHQAQAGLGQRAAQGLGRGQAEHRAVDADPPAARRVADQPVDGGLRHGAAHLNQLDAAAGQLLLGLGPVAAVGAQGGPAGRQHQGAHGAGEAAEPFAALPVAGQVLGQVRVAGGQQHAVEALGGQGLAQQGQAFAGGVGAGVHRGHRFRRRASAWHAPPGPADGGANAAGPGGRVRGPGRGGVGVRLGAGRGAAGGAAGRAQAGAGRCAPSASSFLRTRWMWLRRA